MSFLFCFMKKNTARVITNGNEIGIASFADAVCQAAVEKIQEEKRISSNQAKTILKECLTSLK